MAKLFCNVEFWMERLLKLIGLFEGDWSYDAGDHWQSIFDLDDGVPCKLGLTGR